MSNFHRGASGWQGFRGGIADGRPGGRTPKKLPRQLLHGSPFHSSFQRDRRTLANHGACLDLFLTMPEITFMLAWFLVQPFLKPGACGSFRR